jgi:hypothetical protein
MAFPTPEDLQEQLTQLNDLARFYNPSPDLVGYKSRVQIIEKAKKIVQTLTAPVDMGFHHCQNVNNTPYLHHE